MRSISASQPRPSRPSETARLRARSLTDGPRWVELPAHFVIVLHSRQLSYTRGRYTQHMTAISCAGMDSSSFPYLVCLRQTLCGVGPSSSMRRQAGTRPAAPLSSCDSIPCFHLLLFPSNAFIPTYSCSKIGESAATSRSGKDLTGSRA